MNIQNTIPLADSPAASDYSGDGWGWAALLDEVPIRIWYHPDRARRALPYQYTASNYGILPPDPRAELWFGAISRWVFRGLEKQYPA